MDYGRLQGVRFKGDTDGARQILESDEFGSFLSDSGMRGIDTVARRQLLGNAVRIESGILPDLDRAIRELTERVGIGHHLECFIYQSPMIEASVMKSGERLLIMLSSAAVEKLDSQELEFVVGHELGHVVYDHFQIPTGDLLNRSGIEARQAMKLLSWSRSAEVSADRAGLLCCGSLDVAARAFFKVLSGLSLPSMRINAIEFARQFDALRDALWQHGAGDMWQMSHPLGPLRMRCMILFWDSEAAASDSPRKRISDETCHSEVERMLAFMDPMAKRGSGDAADPLLIPFLTWGGLYIAAANGKLERDELKQVASMVGETQLREALTAPRSAREFRRRFTDAARNREHPLSALDITRIFSALMAVARADGSVDQSEIKALQELAVEMGVDAGYIHVLLKS